MERKNQVVVSGYVSMDQILHISTPAKVGYTSLITNKSNTRIYYGGCSVNIAYGLTRLGYEAAPILRVGKDYEENGFKKFLEEEGVFMEGIQVLEDENTSTCYLLQDNHNEHITIFYPGSMDEKYAQPPEDKLFENAKLAVMTVASKKDNEYFFAKVVEHKIPLVFGMKDDFSAFPKEFLEQILHASHIIFVNEVERQMIEEMYGFEEITELFDKGKVEIIITTKGKEGSVCYHKTTDGIQIEEIGIVAVDKVLDATGSGDAYMAGFLAGYLEGKSCKECCQQGALLSYFVLQKEGCCTNVPTKEVFEEKYQEIFGRMR